MEEKEEERRQFGSLSRVADLISSLTWICLSNELILEQGMINLVRGSGIEESET